MQPKNLDTRKWLLSCLILLILSCSQIAKKEDFRDFNNLTGWCDDDKVCLKLEFTDSLKEVNISLLGQIFQSEKILEENFLQIIVKVTSPDSLQFKQTLHLPLKTEDSENIHNKIGRLVEYEWKYLTRYKPRRKGIWKFEIEQVGNLTEKEQRVYRHLYGIGIRYKE